MKDLYDYYIHSPDKHYGRGPRFFQRDASPPTGFSSLYGVTQITAKAIESAGTTKGFKGVVWGERLWIDVDSYEAADTAERRLEDLGYAYNAFDSGGRGVHFGVIRYANPSHLLPAQDRAWAKEHFGDIADLSIYTHLHLFRKEGTIHEKTGRKKEFVKEVDGRTLQLPKYTEEPITFSKRDSNGSIFDSYRVNALSVPVAVGDRHAALVKLTYALRDDAGVDSDIALWWITEVNKMYQEPKSEEDLNKIVRSIYG